MELEKILMEHGARYPKMQPQDAVKLIYQNEFGGGHLIADEGRCIAYLLAEYRATPQRADIPLREALGNGICRVMLGALDAHGYAPEQLGADFIRGAQAHRGNMDAFLTKLDALRRVTGRGVLSFDEAALEAYLEAYIATGCPAVSHSEEYRQAYAPAYRVIPTE